METPTTRVIANAYPEICITCKLPGKKHSLRNNGQNKYYYRKECNECSNAKRFTRPVTPVHLRIPENEKPKSCTVCGEKDVTFPISGNGSGKWYYRPTCTNCKAKKDLARSNAWRNRVKADNPEAWKLMRRRQQLKRYYGMTLEEYQQKLKDQGGGCAICGRMEGLRDMPVDHCHNQGHVRGILCHYCNKGLGQFFDKPENLRKAADYIDSWVK